jgi:uncharacterized tellurite resistance protein B-like protein
MDTIMDRFETFQNLMIMAAADHKFTDEEVAYLSLRADRWGLTDQQFEQALASAASGTGRLAIPEPHAERVALLRSLIEVMAADGELAPLEKQLFADAAARMNISEGELNQIIDRLL